MRETGSRELVAARQRIERWRKEFGGGRGSRIPDELWSEAAGLARVAGLWATARALRLNYESLKARVGGVAGKEKVAGQQVPAFVDLGMGQLCGSKTVLDMVGRGGERMRIEVTGASTVDVVGLAGTFWGRQA